MLDDVDSQMLSALELLHYCRRFQGQLFAFCFERSEDCEELLVDLRVLHAAGIRQVLFCSTDAGLLGKLELWNRSGHKFLVREAEPDQLRAASFIGGIQRELVAGNQPLVALKAFPDDEVGRLEVERSVMHCAVALGVRKVIFPGPLEGLQLDGRFRSYPSPQELRTARGTNVGADRLAFLLEQQELHRVDMVLVAAKRGAIFREVFTHSGSGTLLTREYPNLLRPAEESDMRDLMAMMRPYVEEGSIKAVPEDELLRLLPSFMVYSVNDQIVAAAALIDYDDSYELGKLCTLPRYQTRGRARDLVRALLDKAAGDGKRGVFALTVQHYVADFFERLGFQNVERETLPAAWRKQYDLSRPSRAFWHPLC